MAKLANKYEKMIEYEDKKFYRKLKAKKKAKNKPTPKKKKLITTKKSIRINNFSYICDELEFSFIIVVLIS